MSITSFVNDEILGLLTPENIPALLLAVFSILLSLVVSYAVLLHYRTVPKENPSMAVRWYGRALPMIAPSLNLIFLSIGFSVMQRQGLDVTLSEMIVDSGLCWFLIALIYVVTHSAAKTIFAALLIIPFAALNVFGLAEDTVTALSRMSFTLGKIHITAWHILKFIISIVLLQWLASAAVMGLEFSFGRMRAMRAGTKQLLTTLSRVAIYGAAILFALSTLGIDLTAFAIFSGAVGVGLGFGLQKIASNFISGLILLLERSVEVGDMIEIGQGGAMGLVKYTGARYTLLETFDNREIMIPNEDFISQRVINWTFSSPRGQLKMPVIVSYDSDLEKARALMLEAVKEHPRVLKDPGPHCLLHEFHDFGVIFTLYAWIGDIREKRLSTQSEIMFSVWKKFSENGIGIPHQNRITQLKIREEAMTPAKTEE